MTLLGATLRKTALLALLICAAPLLASGPIDIGSFDYNGKTYTNAKASMVAPNQVQISTRSASFMVPWDGLNPSAQFRLKQVREEMIAQAEAQAKIQSAERERMRGTWAVKGDVAAVFPEGCAVYCDVPQDGRTDLEQDAVGIVFVRGLKGIADHERVDVRAVKTTETKVIWQTETLRVYDLVAAP